MRINQFSFLSYNPFVPQNLLIPQRKRENMNGKTLLFKCVAVASVIAVASFKMLVMTQFGWFSG